MGMLVGVSPDRKYIYVEYPSEPILAEAAAQLMIEPSLYKGCIRMLRHLASLHIIEGKRIYK